VENSKIEWTDHTFNSWYGCSEVSPACGNAGGLHPEYGAACYARSMMATRFKKVVWGPHGTLHRTSPANWRKPLQWAREARGTGKRPRVFAFSLGDWLDKNSPQEWRMDFAALIRETPELDWLLLTKRIENYRRFTPWQAIPTNVWLAVTAETQEYYDQRWKILQTIGAPVRFISYEPAMGPLTKLRCKPKGRFPTGSSAADRAAPAHWSSAIFGNGHGTFAIFARLRASRSS
jgi:protein gp37